MLAFSDDGNIIGEWTWGSTPRETIIFHAGLMLAWVGMQSLPSVLIEKFLVVEAEEGGE